MRTVLALLALFTHLKGKLCARGQDPSMYQGQFLVGSRIMVFGFSRQISNEEYVFDAKTLDLL